MNYFWIETGTEKIENVYTEKAQQHDGLYYSLVCADLLEDFHENVSPLNSYKAPEQGYKFFEAKLGLFINFDLVKDIKERTEYLLLNNIY
jgi:hypothetical protein